jgi:hypothetical protein
MKPPNIKWFIEDQAFSLSYDLAPPPLPIFCQYALPASCRKTEKQSQLVDGRVSGRGTKEPIVRQRDRLVLYKSFNTLCVDSFIRPETPSAARHKALILDRCRAFDLFASVDAHLCSIPCYRRWMPSPRYVCVRWGWCGSGCCARSCCATRWRDSSVPPVDIHS